MRSLRTIIAGRTPVTATKTATVTEAAKEMKRRGVGSVLVLEGTRLVGIFTERDALYRVVAVERDPAVTRVGDVMTPQPQTTHPDEPFVQALRTMHEGRFRHLPVVEFGRPIGIVTVRDVLDEDLAELRFELEQREEARD